MHIHIGHFEFELIHLFLAYAGMSVHALIQLQKSLNQYKSEFSFKTYMLKNAIHLIADVITIPIIIIIFTDPSMKELWPMNYLTATFTGYTSQSMLHSLFKLKQK